MNETARILCAIKPERTSAKDFVDNLGADRPSWAYLFHMLNALEAQGLISTVRSGHNGVITLQLTPLGAERAREASEEVC